MCAPWDVWNEKKSDGENIWKDTKIPGNSSGHQKASFQTIFIQKCPFAKHLWISKLFPIVYVAVDKEWFFIHQWINNKYNKEYNKEYHHIKAIRWIKNKTFFLVFEKFIWYKHPNENLLQSRYQRENEHSKSVVKKEDLFNLFMSTHKKLKHAGRNAICF